MYGCHARESKEEQKSSNSTSKWSLYYSYSPQRYTFENPASKTRFHEKAQLNEGIQFNNHTITWNLPGMLPSKIRWRKKEEKKT